MKILLLAPVDIREHFTKERVLRRIAKRIEADVCYKLLTIPLADERISVSFNEMYKPPEDTLLWFDPDSPLDDSPWQSTILSVNRIVILLRDSQPIQDYCAIRLYIEYLAFHNIKAEIYFLSKEDLQ